MIRQIRLALGLASFQLADILSTNYALAKGSGAEESNPLMSLSMHYLHDWWFLPKALIAVALMDASLRGSFDSRVGQAVAFGVVVVYTLAISNNLLGAF
jgi:hypothetical protein